MTTTFTEIGKVLDEIASEIGQKIEPVTKKLAELRDGLKEGLKTAERRGFELGLNHAANEARRGDTGHDPSDRIATAIKALKYPE